MKKIAILLVVLLYSLDIISQYDSGNLKKYWYYRYRFINYFTQTGPGFGESLVSDSRNRAHIGATTSKILSWGDQPIDLGFYIGILATEYKLLKDNGRDVSQTAKELYYALEAFNRLDYHAETYWEEPAALNGWFIRNDVPADFLGDTVSSPLNKNLPLPLQNYKFGSGDPLWVDSVRYKANNDHPNASNDRMALSHDQVYGMLMGLGLVMRCVPSNRGYNGLQFMDGKVFIHSEAEAIIDRIMTLLQNQNWRIKLPGTNTKLAHNHGDAYIFAYGTAVAAGKMVGNTTKYLDANAVGNYPTWQAMKDFLFLFDLCNTFNIDDCDFTFNVRNAIKIAAMGDSWRLIVKGIPTINVTDPSILAHADFFDWGSFYSLLWEVMHGKSSLFPDSETEGQLNSAPCSGPFFHGPNDKSPTQWNADNRFRADIDEQKNGSPWNVIGNYSGLDYMLLHNLYYIVNGSNLPAYQNLMDRVVTLDFPVVIPGFGVIGSHNHPLQIDAFRSIRFEGSLDANANVTFRAGEEVEMPDDFGADEGAEYAAFIEPFECQNGSYRNANTTLYGFTDPLPIENNHVPLHYEKVTDEELLSLIDSINSGKILAGQDTLRKANDQKEDQLSAGNTQFNIHPNPTQGQFTIELPYSEEAQTIEVTGLLGKTIHRERVTNEYKIMLSLSKYPKGIYIVKVISGEQVFTERLVLQ